MYLILLSRRDNMINKGENLAYLCVDHEKYVPLPRSTRYSVSLVLYSTGDEDLILDQESIIYLFKVTYQNI